MAPPDHDAASVARSNRPGTVATQKQRKAQMTLTTKLATAMIALVGIAVAAVGWLNYRSVEHVFLPRVLERIESQSRLVAAELEAYVAGARGDIASFRSGVAVTGLIRARQAGGIDPVDGVSEKTWRERIAGRLSAQLEAKPAYAEIRVIGLDDGKREIVRVDRLGPNGTIRIVADAELKRKGDRTFFTETIKLRPDEIYISSLDLNQSDRGIMTPHRPTLRVATPIFASDGKPFGIIIINVDMRPAFDHVRSSARQGEGIYVVNERGDYLVHPDPSREFGSVLGTPTNWQSDFLILASSLRATQSVAQIVPDQAGRQGGIALAPAILAGNEWVAVIKTAPNAAIMAWASTIQNTSMLVGLIAVLCAAALAVLIARSLTRPILQLTAAVEGAGRDGAAAIPVDAGGETGILARAFARVIGEANAKTVALEREIEEHRRTEAARDRHAEALGQEIEERRRIFETSQDLILVADSKGILVQVSPSSKTILGYGPEEMIGRNAVEFIHGDDIDNARTEMRAARRGRDMRNFDSRYVHKDGRLVTLSWMGTWSEPVRRHFVIGRDMTESRLAQEALLESEQMAHGIVDSALDAFVQIDESGTILCWSSQAENIFGWSRSEALGGKLIELIIPEVHRAAQKSGLERFLRTEEFPIVGRRFEIDAQRRDGKEIRVELSITALRRHGGVVFNGFMRDLTDRIAAEDRVRQAEKMEAVGQLTGGIAHDFNNILTVITGTIEILAQAVEKEPQLAAIAKMIDEAASRGADLTQHLLAFARKQPLQPRDADINALIIDTTKLLRPTLGEQIEIETVFDEDQCFAIVDCNQLATALLNLALNARDAMPGGGKLILETGSAYLDENYANLHGDVQPGRYTLIAVSDTGTGIPAGLLDKVFDPFFTSKGPGKGTGLGLSMVYGFVKQSAGHIKIYSEEGHGTTIKMYLPPGTGALLASETAAVSTVQGGQEKILVVEDDKLVRDYVLTQLHSLGYATLDAANAAEALALVAAGHEFDLLFTDVIMPGTMNGRQLANELQKNTAGLKVLFTSGYTENAIIHHGRLDSGVLLLAKPYRKSDLAVMVRTALAG
jgi:PAS domain S-box-containing protein